MECGLDRFVPRRPGERAVSLYLRHVRANRIQPHQHVLQAAAHDEILRAGEQAAVHGIFYPAEKLPLEGVEPRGIVHHRLGREHGARVQPDPIEPVLPVFHQNAPQFMLHGGVGGRDEQSDSPPVTAGIRMALGKLRRRECGGDLAVVDRAGRCDGRHRWRIHIRDENGAA